MLLNEEEDGQIVTNYYLSNPVFFAAQCGQKRYLNENRKSVTTSQPDHNRFHLLSIGYLCMRNLFNEFYSAKRKLSGHYSQGSRILWWRGNILCSVFSYAHASSSLFVWCSLSLSLLLLLVKPILLMLRVESPACRYPSHTPKTNIKAA